MVWGGVAPLLEQLQAAGLRRVGVVVGGIVPQADVPRLLELGIARVFGPGTPLPEIADFLRREVSHAGARAT